MELYIAVSGSILFLHSPRDNVNVSIIKILSDLIVNVSHVLLAFQDGETPCTLAAHSSNGDCARLSEEMVKQRPVVLSTSTVTSDHDSDTDSDDDTDDDIAHLHGKERRLLFCILFYFILFY